MLNLMRLLICLISLPILVLGVGWWINPEQAAQLVGTSIIEGTGKSAQIGDSGALFLGIGSMLLWGAVKSNPHLIWSGACLIGLVIPGRVVSAIFHGGIWTPTELTAETIICFLAIITAMGLQHRANQAYLD